MAGPLFLEHAQGIAEAFEKRSTLYTGHPDTIKAGSASEKLQISATPAYNRTSYLQRALSWFRYAVFAFQKTLTSKSDDLIVYCSNPPILSFVGAAVTVLRPRSFVTIVHDIYPDTITRFTSITESSPLILIWRLVNRFFYEENRSVQTLSEGMANTLSSQFQVERMASKHIQAVYPWADPNFIKPLKKEENSMAIELGQLSKTTVLYSGNLGISHDIDSMLQAALFLREHKEINFLFIGEGEKWQDANRFQKKNRLETVKVLPFQPLEVLPLSLAMADIALVAMEKEAEGLMVPSKTFYYMAAGAAILGLCSKDSDLSCIIERAKCGSSLPAGSAKALADQILHLHESPMELKKLKAESRNAAISSFSKKKSIAQSVKIISDSLRNQSRHEQVL